MDQPQAHVIEAEPDGLDLAIRNGELARDTIIVTKPGAVLPNDLYTHLVLGDDPDAFAKAWSRASRRSREAVGVGLNPDEMKLLQHLTLRTGANGENARKKGPDQVVNLLANLPGMTEKPTLLSHDGIFENIPAYIVGAGPQLDDLSPEDWERMHQTGLVFTVNLASKAGRSNFVVTLESNDVSPKLNADDAILVSNATSHPNVTELQSASTFIWASELGGWIEWATGLKSLYTSASSSTAAASLAERLGCSPIILVGQDLSFPGDLVYAESLLDASAGTDKVTLEGDKFKHDWSGTKDLVSRATNPLPTESDARLSVDVSGNPIRTTDTFLSVAWWFSQQAQRLPVIQTSRRGLRIDGAAHWPLSSVLLMGGRRNPMSFRLNGGSISKFAARHLVREPGFHRYLAGLLSAHRVREYLDPWRGHAPNPEHDSEVAQDMRDALHDVDDQAMQQTHEMLREVERMISLDEPKVYSWMDAAVDSSSHAQGYSDRHLSHLRQAQALRPVDAVEPAEAVGAGG